MDPTESFCNPHLFLKSLGNPVFKKLLSWQEGCDKATRLSDMLSASPKYVPRTSIRFLCFRFVVRLGCIEFVQDLAVKSSLECASIL